MQRNWTTIILGSFLALQAANSASALPPFSKAWMDLYVSDNDPHNLKKAVPASKCAICHIPGAPKLPKAGNHNDYGKAVAKHLNKRDFNDVKDDPEKLRKYIVKGLQQAELERSPSGKSFGELIKAGIPPW